MTQPHNETLKSLNQGRGSVCGMKYCEWQFAKGKSSHWVLHEA